MTLEGPSAYRRPPDVQGACAHPIRGEGFSGGHGIAPRPPVRDAHASSSSRRTAHPQASARRRWRRRWVKCKEPHSVVRTRAPCTTCRGGRSARARPNRCKRRRVDFCDGGGGGETYRAGPSWPRICKPQTWRLWNAKATCLRISSSVSACGGGGGRRTAALLATRPACGEVAADAQRVAFCASGYGGRRRVSTCGTGIMNGDEASGGKRRLETLACEEGGTVVQNPTPSTYCVIADEGETAHVVPRLQHGWPRPNPWRCCHAGLPLGRFAG